MSSYWILAVCKGPNCASLAGKICWTRLCPGSLARHSMYFFYVSESSRSSRNKIIPTELACDQPARYMLHVYLYGAVGGRLQIKRTSGFIFVNYPQPWLPVATEVGFRSRLSDSRAHVFCTVPGWFLSGHLVSKRVEESRASWLYRKVWGPFTWAGSEVCLPDFLALGNFLIPKLHSPTGAWPSIYVAPAS